MYNLNLATVIAKYGQICKKRYWSEYKLAVCTS